MGHQELWESIVSSDDLTAAFASHFSPLATTDECRSILADLGAAVKSAAIEEGCLLFNFEDGVLRCSAPTDNVSGIPEGAQPIYQLHNGMSYPEDGWASNLNPWMDGEFATGWDPDYAEEGDNEDYDDVDFEKMQVPIDNYSDWWIYDTKHTAKNGEPSLAHFSHEDCEFYEPISLEFGLGGYWLRFLGDQILDDDRCEEYCS